MEDYRDCRADAASRATVVISEAVPATEEALERPVACPISRHHRFVPVAADLVALCTDYQYERDRVSEAAESEMVFVNLFRRLLGRAMSYPNAKGMFDRPGHPPIRRWQGLPPHRQLPAGDDAYLFPALSSYSSAGHLNANYISETHPATPCPLTGP